MKKQLQKFMAALALLLFMVPAMVAWGQSYTVEFKSTDTGNDGTAEISSISDIVASGESYITSVASCSKVYKGKSGFGVKLGSSKAVGSFVMNLSNAGKVNATSIVFNACKYGSDNSSLKVTINGSYTQTFTLTTTLTDYTYSFNSATEITSIKIEGVTKRIYVKSTTVNYSNGSATPTVATPTITPNGGDFLTSQEVTLACTTEGATIHYTTDGTTPTALSTQYTAPFTINATTTVKAIAVKSGYDNSEIVSATFSMVQPLANIAALTTNTEAGSYFVTLSNAVVTYDSGNYAYIQDASGAIVMYKNGHGLTAGDVLNGTASVAYQLRNSNPQITDLSGVTPVSGTAPDPISVAVSAWNYTFNDVLSQYFQITGATITQNNSKYYVSLGGADVQLYKVGTTISSLDLDRTYKIVGFPTLYNTTKEIQIFEDPVVEPTTNPVISANNNIEIASDATSGEVAYTIENEVSGGTVSATTTSDWLTLSSDFTSPIAFTCDANTVTTARTATVVLTYTYNTDQTVTKNVTVTQAAYEAPHVTWDLSTDQTATATTDEMTWTSNFATMGVEKGDASTNTNNYYPGTTGQNYTSTRFYKNSVLTISPASGYEITSVVFNATTASYATALQGSTWTNASAAVNGTTVTVTPTDGALAMSATIGATCGFTGVTVYYEEDNTPTTQHTLTVSNLSHVDLFIFGGDESETIISTEDGDVTAQVTAGTNVEISVDVESGYVIQSLMVDGVEHVSDIDADLYMFTMPSHDVTISATAVEYVAPTGDNYTLFTGTLVEGDYLIVYDGKAMNTTVTSDRLQYEEVTANNDVITTNNAAIVWHIAPSGNYWTIYNVNENAYAASTGAKNKAQLLANGADDMSLWTVSGSTTYEFVNKANTANNINAYLRNNGTYGFACYASGTGGALSLYKKAGNEPSINVTPNVVNVDATEHDGILTVTYTAIETSSNLLINWYEADGTTPSTTPAWIICDFNTDKNIEYMIDANTGETRTAYFKIKGLDTDNNEVYSNLVTVTQEAMPQNYTLTIDNPANVTITATYNNEVLNNGENASIPNGTEVTLVAVPAEGYVLGSLTVTNANNEPVTMTETNGVYSFIMPSSNVTVNATIAVPNTYTLATSIESGKEYIFVGKDNNVYYAMGADKGNNRYGIEISANEQTAYAMVVNTVANAHEFTISSLATDGVYSIKDATTSGGYLYAASSNDNHLKTESELDQNGNGNWSITIDSETGQASIIANGTNSHKYMRFNNAQDLFSCYGSNSNQHPIFLYEKVEAVPVTCGITAADLPYTEGFENFTDITNMNKTGILPDCWTMAHEYFSPLADTAKPQIYYANGKPNSGDYCLAMFGRVILAMPQIDNTLDISTLKMSFYLRQHTRIALLEVGVLADLGDENTFTPIATLDNGSSTDAQFYLVDFSQYSGSGKHIAFRNVLLPGYDQVKSVQYIDDISIFPANSQYDPNPYHACDGLDLPYTQDFDNLTSNSTSLTGITPECWTWIGESDGSAPAQISCGSANASSGSYSLYMSGLGTIALPEINNVENVRGLSMKFSVRQKKFVQRLQVGVMDDPDDASSFVMVADIYNGGNYTSPQEHIVKFSSYSGSGKHIAFRNVTTNSTSISENWIDDISIYDAASVSCGISVPYEQGFETDDESLECWNFISEATNTTEPQLSSDNAQSGSHSFYMSGRGYLVLPEITNVNDMSSLSMSFHVKQRKYAQRLEIGVMSAPTDPATFVKIADIYNGGNYATPVEHTVDFASYPGSGRYIVFRNVATTTSTVSQNWIDDISIFVTGTRNTETHNNAFSADGENGYTDDLEEVTAPLGVDEFDLSDFNVWPNPTTGMLNLGTEAQRVEITSLMGQRVAVFENTSSIDISDLTAGVYILKAILPHGEAVRKIVKR